MAKSARAQLLEVNPQHPEPHRIKQAVERLEAGDIVVYPTDTIYGLAADVAQRSAIDTLYALRQLEAKKPLSLVCSSLSQVSHYATIPNDCHRFMKRVLPGPYTFILRATREAPRMGDAKRRTVGVRIPAHPVSLALVQALGRPLLTTSAIVEGQPEDEVPEVSDPVFLAEYYAHTAVALVLDAGLLEGTPSTVIDWSDDDPVVVRQGAGVVEGL